MQDRILITGGAGFIGSHVADELLAHGYSVRALDALVPQVHSEGQARPTYLDDDVELVVGDVRDEHVLRRALEGVSGVIHLAASVGVGQSMYEPALYTSQNNLGTATLLEAVLKARPRRLVVASSMSIYGEGLYRTADGRFEENAARTLEQLRRGNWEPQGDQGAELAPVPTPEEKRPTLESVYALSKFDQERLCLLLGRAYGIDAIALRLFNVYGPRQALSNPYTGVLAIFAARLLNREPPQLFEDGLQRRDFVHVTDVARAFRLALESESSQYGVYNIGSGTARSVLEVAEAMAAAMDRRAIVPEVCRRYRMGDVRHCFADIGRARKAFGYEPSISFEDGLVELTEWLGGQAPQDRAAEARAELDRRGLTI